MFSTTKQNTTIGTPLVNPDEKGFSMVKKLFSIVAGPLKGAKEKANSNPTAKTIKQESKKAKSLKRPAQVIGILGAKGGVGSSILSVNLALAMAESHPNTVLIDCNLQQPDIALSLGLMPKYNLSDLIERRNRLDDKILSACLEILDYEDSRLQVISPSLDLEKGLSTNLGAIPECLDKIKEFTDLVLIDLPKQLDQNLLSLLDSCDKILLVTEPTISSVSGAKRWLSVFSDLDYSINDLGLVFNRTAKKMKHLEEEASKSLGIKTNWQIPSSYNALEQSCLTGIPLAIGQPKDPCAKAIKKMAVDIKNWIETNERTSNV